MFKEIFIQKKGKSKLNLYLGFLWLGLAIFDFFEVGETKNWIKFYLNIVVSIFYFLAYYLEKKSYLIIDKYSIKKTALFYKEFDYRKTSQVIKTQDTIILKNKNDQKFKINLNQIETESMAAFIKFIEEIEQKLNQNA